MAFLCVCCQELFCFRHGLTLVNANFDYDLRLCHFDRRATEWPEVEKSIKKKDFPSGLYASLRVLTPLRFAALEMTLTGALILHDWYNTIKAEKYNVSFLTER